MTVLLASLLTSARINISIISWSLCPRQAPTILSPTSLSLLTNSGSSWTLSLVDSYQLCEEVFFWTLQEPPRLCPLCCIISSKLSEYTYISLIYCRRKCKMIFLNVCGSDYCMSSYQFPYTIIPLLCANSGVQTNRQICVSDPMG